MGKKISLLEHYTCDFVCNTLSEMIVVGMVHFEPLRPDPVVRNHRHLS